MHVATKHVLQFFTYAHLPLPLQGISKQFCDLAEQVANGPDNPETTVSLRKLLEAKDSAVRAMLVRLPNPIKVKGHSFESE